MLDKHVKNEPLELKLLHPNPIPILAFSIKNVTICAVFRHYL